MPRVTHVKHAQQRFDTVPVLDENGQPKKTPILRKDGTQKTTKTGRLIFHTVTVADANQPLPNHHCDKCGNEIKVGDPYKWIQPKSGPYGGSKRFRCESCPTWQPWEYSSSLSARIAEIQNSSLDFSEVTNAEEVGEFLNDIASQVRELAEEKQQGADNIEDGFGHSTSSSEELADIAQQLEGWADELEGIEIPDPPEAEETDCEECEGTGEIDNEEYDPEVEGSKEKIECPSCEEGRVTPEEPTDDQLEEWRSEIEALVDEAVGNSPV